VDILDLLYVLGRVHIIVHNATFYIEGLSSLMTTQTATVGYSTVGCTCTVECQCTVLSKRMEFDDNEEKKFTMHGSARHRHPYCLLQSVIGSALVTIGSSQ
jgi:hypothetical protein